MTKQKIGTRSVHVGSLSEVSQDTPNYNCTLLSIVTMLNTLHDRYFAGYAQTQANCNIEEYRLQDDNDIVGFSWPKGKITVYKLAIKHNTLHFSYAKDLAVSCLLFIIFV